MCLCIQSTSLIWSTTTTPPLCIERFKVLAVLATMLGPQSQSMLDYEELIVQNMFNYHVTCLRRSFNFSRVNPVIESSKRVFQKCCSVPDFMKKCCMSGYISIVQSKSGQRHIHTQTCCIHCRSFRYRPHPLRFGKTLACRLKNNFTYGTKI